MTKKLRVRIHPDLRDLLRQNKLTDTPIRAIIMLRARDPRKPIFVPRETKASVDAMVVRAREKTGQKEQWYTVFGYLGSFAISASAEFLNALLTEEEVGAAIADTIKIEKI